jgi:hypothetical protein
VIYGREAFERQQRQEFGGEQGLVSSTPVVGGGVRNLPSPPRVLPSSRLFLFMVCPEPVLADHDTVRHVESQETVCVSQGGDAKL